MWVEYTSSLLLPTSFVVFAQKNGLNLIAKVHFSDFYCKIIDNIV